MRSPFFTTVAGVSAFKAVDQTVDEDGNKVNIPKRADITVPSPQGVIKESKAPAWYEDMFQKESESRTEEEEKEYSLPSVPTWRKFENSKVGKLIDAKGLVKEKDLLLNALGYGEDEEADLAMDVGAFVTPAADVVHAVSKTAERKYLDAGLYALFAAVPGAAGPLVNKAKQLLNIGKPKAAKELLENTIKKNKDVIKRTGTNVDNAAAVTKHNVTKVDKSYKPRHFDASVHPREITNKIKTRGSELDKFVKGKGPTAYTRESITILPTIGKGANARHFVRVDLPNGQQQIFYRSSGQGGKAGSKGKWIPFEGTRPMPGQKEWFVKMGSEGKFHGEPMSTIENYMKNGKAVTKGTPGAKRVTTGVHEQIKKLGLDPWEEIAKGNLKIDKWGHGFNYGSKEFGNISEQLSKIMK